MKDLEKFSDAIVIVSAMVFSMIVFIFSSIIIFMMESRRVIYSDTVPMFLAFSLFMCATIAVFVTVYALKTKSISSGMGPLMEASKVSEQFVKQKNQETKGAILQEQLSQVQGVNAGNGDREVTQQLNGIREQALMILKNNRSNKSGDIKMLQ